ncbi:hypothetical protein BLJ79_17430 [Arthrobacter sp. UCD-GKA]|uniref:hypothetical protein n=1 Tax=Arthrobacter sp. UCD-GKA TaxID=1913576 RepID=UPI0008DE425D|nr:hypothetical protein [Arthrobacter sp. UCD-GKA]OIH83016.1 hypothetical protein BLJ79_17430 [Arthrobacter sp. UCD-GKA]
MTTTQETAERIGALFNEHFSMLDALRTQVEGGMERGADLDALVLGFVQPRLMVEGATVAGAGYIGGPGSSPTPGVGGAKAMHFAWWLGPLAENPLSGTTTEVTRLDLAAREYADYLRDFSSLEWYSVPESTGARHITGPYVDHLCTCDYMLTLTTPVGARGAGIVGLDILVRKIEPQILRLLRAIDGPAALATAGGRIIVSTADDWDLGSSLKEFSGCPVPGTTLVVATGENNHSI